MQRITLFLIGLMSFASVSCTKNSSTRQALEYAIEIGDTNRIESLLRDGCDISSPDKWGNRSTPLMWAMFYDQREMVAYLLGKGADPNQKNIDGQTALHFATIRGDKNAELVGLLIKYGADVNAKDLRGQSALSWAQAKPYAPTIVDILKSHGAKE